MITKEQSRFNKRYNKVYRKYIFESRLEEHIEKNIEKELRKKRRRLNKQYGFSKQRERANRQERKLYRLRDLGVKKGFIVHI